MEQLVEFRNSTGKWLRGMVHVPPEKRGRPRFPGAVFFHGFTGDRMESHWIFVKCARELARAGLASLRFDFYGSGESEGEFQEVTLQKEIADALSAVRFFRGLGKIDGLRTGLLGLSLGGAIAAEIAAKVRARALVLWSALARPAVLRDLAASVAKPLPGGAVEYEARIVSPKFLAEADRVKPLASIRRFKAPTLILHPERDAYLPPMHAEEYFQAAGAEVKEKVIIPGADHTYSSVVPEREVIERTVAWFGKYLPAGERT